MHREPIINIFRLDYLKEKLCLFPAKLQGKDVPYVHPHSHARTVYNYVACVRAGKGALER